MPAVQKAKEADLHRLADALLEHETLTASEIRQVRHPCLYLTHCYMSRTGRLSLTRFPARARAG